MLSTETDMAEISIQPNYNTPTTNINSNTNNINSSNNSHNYNNGYGEALKLGRDGFESLLEAQRELIHSQLKDLQKLALRQCQITGTNPLAQEMVRCPRTYTRTYNTPFFSHMSFLLFSRKLGLGLGVWL